jgi:redox-sensing transcriptional repressor
MSEVPDTTVQRLPVYLRALLQCKAERIPLVNSVDIAHMAGTNAAQVRKDLSYLGELGTRGIGYDVDSLIGDISARLGLTEERKIAVVGAGRLGTALVSYRGLAERGFQVVAVFDSDPAKVGLSIGEVVVRPVADLETALCEGCVDIAVITTPADAAQDVADRVVRGGVTAILNFAPVTLSVPEGIAVRHVDLSVELQVLSFYLTEDRR